MDEQPKDTPGGSWLSRPVLRRDVLRGAAALATAAVAATYFLRYRAGYDSAPMPIEPYVDFDSFDSEDDAAKRRMGEYLNNYYWDFATKQQINYQGIDLKKTFVFVKDLKIHPPAATVSIVDLETAEEKSDDFTISPREGQRFDFEQDLRPALEKALEKYYTGI